MNALRYIKLKSKILKNIDNGNKFATIYLVQGCVSFLDIFVSNNSISIIVTPKIFAMNNPRKVPNATKLKI